MSRGGSKLSSHEYAQVGLTRRSLWSMQSHFLTSPGLGWANRVHQYWFYSSPRVSASNSALPFFLLWQSPRSLLRAHLGTLAGRSYQVSSKEESFTDGAFLLLILLVFCTALQLQYCLADMGVLENACMLTAPVPGSPQCKRDAILTSRWSKLTTHHLSYTYWPLPIGEVAVQKTLAEGEKMKCI